MMLINPISVLIFISINNVDINMITMNTELIGESTPPNVTVPHSTVNHKNVMRRIRAIFECPILFNSNDAIVMGSSSAIINKTFSWSGATVSYTHLRAHET